MADGGGNATENGVGLDRLRSSTLKPLLVAGLLDRQVGQQGHQYHSTKRSLRLQSRSQTTLAGLCAFRLGRTEPNGKTVQQVLTLRECAEGCWQEDENLREPR